MLAAAQARNGSRTLRRSRAVVLGALRDDVGDPAHDAAPLQQRSMLRRHYLQFRHKSDLTKRRNKKEEIKNSP